MNGYACESFKFNHPETEVPRVSTTTVFFISYIDLALGMLKAEYMHFILSLGNTEKFN